jgi:hypothetical protein
LRSEIENADSVEGIDWGQLERLRSAYLVPTRGSAELWILQVVLLIPVLLLISAGLEIARSRERGWIPLDAARIAGGCSR